MPDDGPVDLSDYARGLAVWLVRPLAATRVRAWHITWVHFIVMVVAAICLRAGGLTGTGWAALLLMVKNVLDAADGSLARLQQRPSRVGRFLDSNLDFVGHALFFAAVPGVDPVTRLAGFLFFTLQGSVFNYYMVWYRTVSGGDDTSRLREEADSPYSWDSPVIVQRLYRMYRVCYGWQDWIVDRLDRGLCPERSLPSRRLLALFSALGPGFQYLFIVMLLVAGIPQFIPDLFVYVFSVYSVCLLLARAQSCRRVSP